MLKRLLSITLILFFMSGYSQKVSRIDPPNWWVGMKNQKLQLMVYGQNISSANVSINYNGVILESVEKVENSNYLFLNLTINTDAKTGKLPIEFKFIKGKLLVIQYELKDREKGSAERKGFDNSDVVYLIVPDRFSDGNQSIDSVKGMPDKHNRKEPYARHGGDFQGIINHMDYFDRLGVTSLWLTPVLENNQPQWSYHGYAITDFYKIDARFGTNELYKEFVNQAHSKKIKVIKDLIFNHCGGEHWWLKDLPSADWFNQWPQFTRTNYRIPTIFDIHASESEKKLMNNGWFDHHMPDLNQKNPYVANYLLQNSIWWIEYAGIDGIRMDTHPYPDKDFMARWCTSVMAEYPNLNIVGETWVNYPAWVAYWQKDAKNADGYNSNLPVAMDFPLMYAMHKAFSEKDGWDTGLSRLYEILAHDFIYPNPNNLLIFADNHDVGRFQRDSSQAMGNLKLAMAFLLTTRGIPQIYYGTEVLMVGNDINGHGDIRKDFPGGWASDKHNAFVAEGRNKKQAEIWDYMSKILNWRKNATAVHNGKLIHFIPENEVYVYFRYNQQQTVMVILNNGYQPKVLDTVRFNEFLGDKKSGVDIVSGKAIEDLTKLQLSPRSAMIIELK
jgi:glycosidase